MSSLHLDRDNRAPRDTRGTTELVDIPALVAELETIARRHEGHESEMRAALAAPLKNALAEGRAKAEQLLLKDRSGRRCAERLCRMEDEIIGLLYDFVRKHLYPSENPSDAERMAVVATGGYGRGLQAPGSDIDLLFLLPYKQTAWSEQVAEAILYCLWDTGLKVGHATRSVDECIRQAKADMTIRTAILEARFLFGDRNLYDELVKRFDTSVVQGTAAQFVAAKLAEREDRHRRSGQSRYLVEPNVKDGKGGLRDLHTLFWIAKYVYRVREPEELLKRGVFDKHEYALFRRCEEFLWAVRCHLHFITGRAEERLSFDLQREIAVRLGYTEHPGMKDVERFMKHYFLTAKDVGDLTAIVAAELEDSHAKSPPVLSRMMDKLRPAKRRAIAGTEDFIVDNNRITIAASNVFRRDPANLIRIFHLAQKHNLAFHPDAMRAMTRSLKLVDAKLRDNEEANALFLEILTSKNDPETVLRRMNESGVLGKFVPAFGKIVAMMQFNMYHHYTVDEHLLRCIGILQEIERGGNNEMPLATELFRTIQPRHRDLLYVTLFLHDIAKGRPEDHSIAGARVARRFCPRLGFSAADTELVAWLIEQHLTMSSVAQSRDLSDRKTIENFAAVVQSVERLKLLTILTTADIRGVGPGVWNTWKSQLIRTLYYETEPTLTGGFSEVNRNQRVAMAQAELREALTDWPAEQVDAYIARLYPAYWLKVGLGHKVAHARFVREAEAAKKRLATAVAFDTDRGVTELTVFAPDHPWLLSIIAGACAMTGANIVDAQIFTTTDGLALDTIAISRAFERDDDEERRAARIADSIEKALRGDLRLPDVVTKRAPAKGRIKAFAIEPAVTINNQWSHRYTMVEVTGLDRTGLLYDLTTTLSKLSLNIASA
ncbi:MAG: [protein-PII] uridylyltransferase, partial [Pseudolabrys sp.]|nr:[protein-PII] uridylyltransferase [Pseudolabrys sp.]